MSGTGISRTKFLAVTGCVLFLPACANIMAHLDAFPTCFFGLSLHASVCQNKACSEHIKPFTLIFKQVAYLKRMFFSVICVKLVIQNFEFVTGM